MCFEGKSFHGLSMRAEKKKKAERRKKNSTLILRQFIHVLWDFSAWFCCSVLTSITLLCEEYFVKALFRSIITPKARSSRTFSRQLSLPTWQWENFFFFLFLLSVNVFEVGPELKKGEKNEGATNQPLLSENWITNIKDFFEEFSSRRLRVSWE